MAGGSLSNSRRAEGIEKYLQESAHPLRLTENLGQRDVSRFLNALVKQSGVMHLFQQFRFAGQSLNQFALFGRGKSHDLIENSRGIHAPDANRAETSRQRHKPS